jgi:hypothetical protein
MTPKSTSRPRIRIELLLVALVCFGPMIGAYLLYYGGEPRELPRLINAERQLLDPPVVLPPLAAGSGEEAVDDVLAGARWTLIYATTAACAESCLAHLVRLRQVHLALGRDQDRVQRLFLGPRGDGRVARDPAVVIADEEGGTRVLEVFRSVGLPPGDEGRVYVADPHGNLVLSYPPDADQGGIRDDLKRLLSVSRIG